MALTMRIEGENYIYREQILQLTPETIQASRDEFERLRNQGTIQAEGYDADIWYMTDEVHRPVALQLGLDEIAYSLYAQPLLHCKAEIFKQAFRVVITSNIGRSVIGMRDMVNAIRNYVCRDGLDASKVSNIATNGLAVINLLILLPGEYPEKIRLIDDLETYLEASEEKGKFGEQRFLAYYQTYFRFDTFLRDFWKSATKKERLLFFPVYLWWRITMIIPLRPTEFVLTPRRCIVEEGGKVKILLRRTKRKGKSKAVKYSISEDYSIHGYHIPKDLAEEVNWYLTNTEAVYASDIDTLFCKTTQFDAAGVLNANDGHYSYGNLMQCLDRYYRDILERKYNLTIVMDKQNILKDGEIGKISLGDTRHIALINLVMSGASLQVCKELAGHDNISSASHYYTNITSLLDAFSLTQQYRMPIEAQDQQMILFDVAEGILVNQGEGLCFSPKVAEKDYSDCACVCDQYGYTGTCDCCRYYLPNSAAKEKQTYEHAKMQLHNTCVLLQTALEQYRKGIGKEQTIRSTLEKLRTDALVYGQKTVLERKRGGYYAEIE